MTQELRLRIVSGAVLAAVVLLITVLIVISVLLRFVDIRKEL